MASDISPLQQAKMDHRTGYHYHAAKEFDEAIKWYEKGASAGLAKSEYAIGRILAFDREDNHDFDAALPWIIRAAAPRAEPQGYGYAQSQQQAVDSLNWYCKNGAAKFPSKHPHAQDPKCWHGRAKALMFGWFNIQTDKEAARTLLEKAIAEGWTDAQVTLDKLDRRSETRAAKPIETKKVLFILFMLLLMSFILRGLRIRQIIFGLIYKFTA